MGGSGGATGGGSGGNGGNGAVTGNTGKDGNVPGGGGGGGSSRTGGTTGGGGASGQITLIYSAATQGTAALPGEGTLTAQGGPAGIATLSGVGSLTATQAGSGHAALAGVGTITPKVTLGAGATLSGVGTMSAVGGLPTATMANQWQNNYGQGSSFGSIVAAGQSCVVPLTPAFHVGTGSGVSTAGNWLFAIVSWTQFSNEGDVYVSVGDDIHSYWREYPAAGPGGNVRTTIAYTPNIARSVGTVYVAPTAEVAAINVIVIEIGGLGNWDTITGTATNYTASGTSLNLSLGAPAQAAFTIAGFGGNNVSAGMTFAPGGWTTLTTETQSNGTDTTADNILAGAFLPSTLSSQSVTATSSAQSIAGFMLQVLVGAPSPIPNGHNPNWPYLFFETGFGAGFNTPNSEVTWTDLTNRLWDWREQTGVQFQLGQLQATSLGMELDNFDTLLTPGNPQSYFYTASGANWHPAAAFYDSLVDSSSPLAWWVLDDASGSSTAADSSGNGETGTATSVTFGRTNEAVTGNTSASFASASTSHILTSYNPSFTAVTVEAWVNYNGLSQGANSPRLIANGHPDSDNKGFQLMVTNGGQPQFWVGKSTGNGNAAGGTVPATGWTHLVGTYDGANVKIYVNGVLKATTAFTGTVVAGLASGIGLGYNPTYNGDYLNGLLAECAVYGTALTAEQVAAHYTAGMTVSGTPVRIRAAVGTMGGVQVNRWYVIQRNVMQWSEVIEPSYRKQITVEATDLWAAMSSTPPTFFRAEMYQDSPYAWWPMDDQALEGGVLPTSLLNAASGNTTTMSIVPSPNGVSGQDAYSTSGTILNDTALQCPPPGVAVYSVGANSGWMYGDPASSASSFATATGNPVESAAGSASWQQSGALGSGGTNGWFLSYNDTNLPGLSGGVTVKGWFNALFFGTAAGYQPTSGNKYIVAGQPYSVLTVCTLATASAPVAVLQLDLNGHLNLITYNGTTGTSHSVYSASDLRSEAWVSVDISLTTTTWNVLVNGGLTANVSGSATGMTSAWTYLILNGDMGTSGGASPAAIQHGGNIAYSHWAVFPYILPTWKLLHHYTAAITGFGLIPPPFPSAQLVFDGLVGTGTQQYALPPDGSTGPFPNGGSYGAPSGPLGSATTFTFSALAVTNAGSYTSGPSPRATIAGSGQHNGQTFGNIVWTSWTGVGPYFTVYTSSSADNETAAATVAGSGDSFTSGYGSGAAGAGVCQTGGGSGASPPVLATPLGDTAGQRIERLMKAGRTVSPSRCIDPASDLVQSPGFSGNGTQAGAAVQAIQQSDGGILFVDNCNKLNYWERDHLAAQYSSPAWVITPNAPPTAGASATTIPYYRQIQWITDPQRVWNVIEVSPFSPSGAQLPSLTPVAAANVAASQQQYGAQPLAITSWLQDQSVMQSQANWLFAEYGVPRRRIEGLKIDAAPYPAAFSLVLGINVGDIVTVQDWAVGGGGSTYTYRVSSMNRTIVYGEEEESAEASVTLTLDYEPTSYY